MRIHAIRLTLLALLAAVPLTAAAQDTDYIVTAAGWGAAQAAAVSNAGGSVVFSHAGAGVAVVRSSAANFWARLLSSGVVSAVAADQVVSWTQPTEAITIEDNAINPANDTLYPLQWAPGAIDAPLAWAAGDG